jgi:hypothetical protein
MLLWSWLGLLSIGGIIGLAPVYEIGIHGFWRFRNNFYSRVRARIERSTGQVFRGRLGRSISEV